MNPGAFPAIFPSSATGATVVMISSMSSDANSPAMKIIDATYDDGTPVMRKLDWVQSCTECKRKGIPEKCTHVSRRLQHFQSVATQSRLSKLLPEDAFKREILYVVYFFVLYTGGREGEIRRDRMAKQARLKRMWSNPYSNQSDEPLISCAFRSAWIDDMVSNDFRLNEDISHLFITVDPSAGKGRNKYALCSTVYTRDGTCVVCLPSILIRTYKERSILHTLHQPKTVYRDDPEGIDQLEAVTSL